MEFDSEKCICYGVFKNTGDSIGLITKANLTVTITDPNDELIFSFEREFNDMNAYLRDNLTLDWEFETELYDIPEYYGEYNWRVDHQIWWDNM